MASSSSSYSLYLANKTICCCSNTVVGPTGPTGIGISGLVYADPGYDITDDVMKEINKDRPASAPAAPAAAPAAGITVPGIAPKK